MNYLTLLVGLGNPGPEYSKTRHNAGFWFLDKVACYYGASFTWQERFGGWVAKLHHRGEVCHLLKPGLFMNRSGGPVASYCRFYKIPPPHVLVAHDELDFAPGIVKLKKNGGHGGHNGLRSIIDRLGDRSFIRLRIGIGRPTRGDVSSYVLSKPSPEEEKEILCGIERAVECLPVLMEEGVDKAMNLLHQSPV